MWWNKSLRKCANETPVVYCGCAIFTTTGLTLRLKFRGWCHPWVGGAKRHRWAGRGHGFRWALKLIHRRETTTGSVIISSSSSRTRAYHYWVTASRSIDPWFLTKVGGRMTAGSTKCRWTKCTGNNCCVCAMERWVYLLSEVTDDRIWTLILDLLFLIWAV